MSLFGFGAYGLQGLGDSNSSKKEKEELSDSDSRAAINNLAMLGTLILVALGILVIAMVMVRSSKLALHPKLQHAHLEPGV